MFDHFTFGASPTSYYGSHEMERELSPSDCSLPSPASPPPTLQSFPEIADGDDIISRFARQSLLLDESENERPQKSFCTMDVEEEFSRDQISFVSTSRGMAVVSANTTTPPLPDSRSNGGCRRLKRQLNMQLQTSTSHIKDINALVEDMISSESQCVLRQSPLRSQPPSRPASRGQEEPPTALMVDAMAAPALPPSDHPLNLPFMIEVDEDEGFHEMDEDAAWNLDEELSLRRASTPSGIRKYHGLKWRRSFEVSGLPSRDAGVPARMKVRSVPRMRRRKPKTLSE